ncbi:MAG: phosphopentomutase [Clostridiales bacterium]|nr:phosphopentomutase [Clostridiales bacterium]
MAKRFFLIVLDSFGVGELPDAYKWHDEGSNTLGAIRNHPNFNCPELKNMGLFNIDGVGGGVSAPKASYAKMAEKSAGKDTTIGHWEIAGIISPDPLPTYPDGFPDELIKEFVEKTGRQVICNKPYSGTEVIKDYGRGHVQTGALIVYTSADSVFQIAAHEDIVPVEKLYEYCEIARKMLVGKHGVGRVIARPFNGEYPYTRTANRHDFSLLPPADTMLNILQHAGYDTISVGKINDIFAGSGISESYRTTSNTHGMQVTKELQEKDFSGLCFVNLVDFDMKYGHRNDVPGYAAAATEFDGFLTSFVKDMREDDVLLITADHGCDPATTSTDHSREYTPMLIYGNGIKNGVNLGTRASFSDISATVLEYFGVAQDKTQGESFLRLVQK